MWKKPWQITVNPKGVHFCILKIIQYVSDSILFSTTKSTRPQTFNLFRLICFLQNPQVSGLHLHSVSRCWGRSAFLTNMPHSECTQGSLTNSQLLVWACWKRYKEIINWRTTVHKTKNWFCPLVSLLCAGHVPLAWISSDYFESLLLPQ